MLLLLAACTEYALDKEHAAAVDSDSGFSPDTGYGCEPGYLATYYNLPADHPDMESDVTGYIPGDSPANHDWWDAQYYAFEQVDPGLDFGDQWWPVDQGLAGDPQYFSVHWSARVEASATADYLFELGSDDDGWALIDGAIVGDLGGIHAVEQTTFTVPLSAGAHRLDLYMAERHTSDSGFWFRWESTALTVGACP